MHVWKWDGTAPPAILRALEAPLPCRGINHQRAAAHQALGTATREAGVSYVPMRRRHVATGEEGGGLSSPAGGAWGRRRRPEAWQVQGVPAKCVPHWPRP